VDGREMPLLVLISQTLKFVSQQAANKLKE